MQDREPPWGLTKPLVTGESLQALIAAMGWVYEAAGKVNCIYVTKFKQRMEGAYLVISQYFWLCEFLPNPQKKGTKGEREIDGYGDMLLELMGYLLLRHSKCPPGLLAAVPAAGPSHASTYSPLKTTASSTASPPAPATSAATAMVPARPISAAATITPRPELPSGESSAN